ncbi:MAG TPA: sialidase family protein [Burkholderiaceae bacterium]|nr:sialidase family protein [Burkholderiaceae bacterium]
MSAPPIAAPPIAIPPPPAVLPPVNLPPRLTDTEVQVSTDTPFTLGCLSGGGTVYRNAEVEPQVAINPRNPDNIVITWQQDRWSNGGSSGIVTAASTDGGSTWTRAAFPVSRCGGGNAGNGGDYGRATDPWVTFGPTGIVYQMALAFEGTMFSTGSASAVMAARSTDGGRTWSAATPLIVSDKASFNDKNSITADPTDPNFAYATWDRLASGGGGPSLMARTTDGGLSWEAARVIYDPGTQSQTIGNQILVLPNGTLVNVFTQIDPGPNNSEVATIRLIRSTDRGGSWSAPIIVSGLTAIGASDPTTQVPIRDGSIVASVTIAPNGTLWAAWQDARFSNGTIDGIVLARSVDGGLTWSTPVQVNSVRNVAAFTPTVRLRADGTLAVMYYDLRSDTTDRATLPTELILARSADAVNWTETRVTDSFDLDTAPQASGAYFLGDYQGLEAQGNVFVPVYVRTTGNPQDRTDVFMLQARSIAAAAPPVRYTAAAGASSTANPCGPAPARTSSARWSAAFPAGRAGARRRPSRAEHSRARRPFSAAAATARPSCGGSG